jgi:hypothetical protein
VIFIHNERSSWRNFLFGNCPMSILTIKLNSLGASIRINENDRKNERIRYRWEKTFWIKRLFENNPANVRYLFIEIKFVPWYWLTPKGHTYPCWLPWKVDLISMALQSMRSMNFKFHLVSKIKTLTSTWMKTVQSWTARFWFKKNWIFSVRLKES